MESALKSRLAPAFDLLGLWGGALFLLLIGGNGGAVARGLAVGLVLLGPGYAGAAILFPAGDALTWIERLGLSIGLSFVGAFAVGWGLSYLPVGLTAESVRIALFVWMTVGGGIAYRLRTALPPERRFALRGWSREWLAAGGARAFWIIFAVSGIGLLGVLVYSLSVPRSREAFTEFYVLNSDSKIEGYPAAAGRPVTVILGVSNHELEPASYRIVRDGCGQIEPVAEVALRPGQRWEAPYEFTPSGSDAGERCELQLLLYRDGGLQPYRSLHLWIAGLEK